MNRQSECTQGALLMLDLDRFKSINDTYGHAAGDAVLQDFSGRINSALRSDDWVARIGGEEFVVWLPDIPQKTAPNVAERMRRVVASNPIVFGDHTIQYTVSIGLHYVSDVQPGCLDSWMKDADRLLYRAKSEGRNRVVCQFA